ncbi:MAG: Ig-like domain-containing protein [Bacteroidetes bacterium]|nr:Ig-like domain-containing protein [Bacteroidota bacterium]
MLIFFIGTRTATNPFILLIFLLYNCAQVSSPTGDPKDTSPPKIRRSEPLNFSTNFSGKKITLEFNEFISTADVQKEVIISPPMKEFPDFRVSGKKLTIVFNEELIPNTTYSLYLGKSVKDVNEGNPSDSNLFIFSTGTFLDSMEVTGTVLNAYDLKPADNVFVMLYTSPDDSAPCKELPLYYAKTNSVGLFRIQHIKAASYRVFALADKTGNFFFDAPEEPVAFLDTPVAPPCPALTLRLFTHARQKQFILKSSAEKTGEGRKITILFALPGGNPSVRLLNYTSGKKPWEISESSPNGDTLTLFTTILLDTFNLEVYSGNMILDTLLLSATAPSTRKSPKFSCRTTLNSNGTLDYFRNLVLEFSYPVSHYDLAKFILTQGSDTMPVKGGIIDTPMRRLELTHAWKQSTSYSLFIPSGSVHDIFGFTNDTIKLTFTSTAPELYGNLNVVLTGSILYPIIIQLINEKEQVIRENKIFLPAALKYDLILPGKCKLKAIVDVNGNGKWDAGDYFNKIQPEQVYYYQQPLTIRANWEHEMEWDIK